MVIVDARPSLKLLQQFIDTGKLNPKDLGWGTGTRKSLEHLEKEARSGDATFSTYTPQKGPDVDQEFLLREITSANVYVFAYRRSLRSLGRKRLYVLHEDWQEYKRKGKPTKRRDNYFVSEKMHPDEIPTPAVGAKRAVEEELGILVDESRFTIPRPEGKKKKPQPSETYPGIYAEKTIVRSSVLLHGRREIRREYIEDQNDKRTKFSWKQVDKVKDKHVQQLAEPYRRRS